MPAAPLLSKILSDDEPGALRLVSLSVVSDVNSKDNSPYTMILAHVLAPMFCQDIAFEFSCQEFCGSILAQYDTAKELCRYYLFCSLSIQSFILYRGNYSGMKT
jgi:hypothetical protein